MHHAFDQEAEAIRQRLPPGPRLVVIGSTSFYGADSCECCCAIAAETARSQRLIAITGGMSGVGDAFAREWAAARSASGLPEDLFHVLPRDLLACTSGTTLHAGGDFLERREILARIGDVYLAIEGGPGTVHEAEVALDRGAPVIPIARTGGYSTALHAKLTPPVFASSIDWSVLADSQAPMASVAEATARLIAAALSHCEAGN